MRFINAFPDIIHRIQKIILIQISKRAARIKIVAATDMNGNGIGSLDFGSDPFWKMLGKFGKPVGKRFRSFLI